MDYIKEHKKMVIAIGLLIILIILISIVFKLFMVDGSKSSYGDRLDGMSKVKISEETISKLEDELEKKEEVSKATYRRQGRLIYVDMIVENGVNVDISKEIANTILDYFDDKEKKYYDIQIIINEKDSSKESAYPIIGYKHKTAESIVW